MRISEALRRLCEEAGDIGPILPQKIACSVFEEEDVKEALRAWEACEDGALEALQNMHLARILETMGAVVGEGFGLDNTRASHFGYWLAQAVTGWCSGLSNDDEIEALNALAGRAVHGRDTGIGFAWTYADWWMRYQRAMPPIMARLREESA